MEYVYLIRAGQTDNYKIGITNNIESRLNTLRTSHYEELILISKAKYTNRFMSLLIEEELHNRYSLYRLRGEWFKLNDKHTEEIIKEFESGITEILSLKARIKELEQQVILLSQNKENKNCSEQKKTKKRYKAITKEQVLQALYNNGAIGAGNKLTPKSSIVNTKKRQENQRATNYYKEFERLGIIENRGLGRNGGYYAVADYQTALNTINSD